MIAFAYLIALTSALQFPTFAPDTLRLAPPPPLRTIAIPWKPDEGPATTPTFHPRGCRRADRLKS